VQVPTSQLSHRVQPFPQAPQLAGSRGSAAQYGAAGGPQEANCEGQAHAPCTHRPSLPHDRPQAPQLLGSVWMATQKTPPSLETHAPRPAGHAGLERQTAARQTSPGWHEAPQAPQLSLSDWRSVQVGGRPSEVQSVSPGGQAICGVLQTPSEQ